MHQIDAWAQVGHAFSVSPTFLGNQSNHTEEHTVTNRPSDVTQAKIQLKNVSNSSQLPNAPISTQVHPAAFELKECHKGICFTVRGNEGTKATSKIRHN